MFVLDILKSRCKLITLWGSTCSKKRLAGRSFFQNMGSQGPGRISPSGSLSAALEPFFHVEHSGLNGALIVELKYHIKASVTIMAFGRGKSNHTLARCVFFYQHCFTKNIET